jgi:hypothetical protein
MVSDPSSPLRSARGPLFILRAGLTGCINNPALGRPLSFGLEPSPHLCSASTSEGVPVLLRLGGLRPALTKYPQVSPLVSNVPSVAPIAIGVNASEPIDTCKALTVTVIALGPGRHASYPQYHLLSFSG